MGHHLPDYELTDQWVDLASLSQYSEISGAAITVGGKYVHGAVVFVGGTDAPDDDSGTLLISGGSLSTTNTNWWVKGQGVISIFVD